ncbi:hypothetical protein C1645_830581 [Glomus cerebriforme]|uniref:SAM domain-containing protein n=1 Tax=Glomus cerebriforme TaxID=658196 RepID=A0A397SNR0_9GLOM|nr:hypothetical protein C1645_830581 [Glomus cerebriforme]
MSKTSISYTPASTSTTVAGNETVSLVDEIKKYDTAKLIEYLQGQEDLGLDDNDLEIIRKEKVSGRDFLKLTEEKLEHYGMKMGPASRLADFAKECKEKKLKAFFSYKTKADLEKVLQEDYKISSGDITLIPQFKPVTCLVDENSPKFKLCIDDILRRIRNMGPVVDSNEAMHCKYISTILHTALSLLEGLIITPQMKITGEINTGRVDYAIKKILDDLLEEIICITEGKQNQATMGICQNLLQCRSACDMNINMSKKKRKVNEAFDPDYEYVYGIVSTGTDWYFILHSTEDIYITSRTEYRISLTEDALKDDTELCKNVKRVLEVILGLLKDRALDSEEPATKKHRLEARNVELETENAEIPELRKKLAEIPELKKKLVEVEARNVKIEARNAKLMKQMIEENNQRDARIEKLEEKQLQSDNTPNNNLSNFTLAPLANLGVVHHEKSLQEKEIDIFLDEEDKKIVETVNNNEKSYEPEINEITNCTSSEISHETEVIEDIANSAMDSKTINDRSASEEIEKIVFLGYDRSASENSKGIRKTVSLGYDRVASGSLEEIDKADYQDKSVRVEITAWCLFSERFENKVLELRSENKKLANRIARTQIYAKMKPYLTGISDEYLRVRTSRARKINKLFGFKYDPVTLKKIDEQVKSKAITDQSHVNEISETMANTSANDPSDDNSFISAEEEDYLKMITGSIDEETAYWGIPYEAGIEKENKTSASVVTPASRAKTDMYFDEKEEETNEIKSNNDSNSSDSEEGMPNDSDNDDGYGGYSGYNEYECDRGYYYRDGRYERKTSPMMSPIISPVTPRRIIGQINYLH